MRCSDNPRQRVGECMWASMGGCAGNTCAREAMENALTKPFEYRADAYGRPVHKDLDALAKEIMSAMDAILLKIPSGTLEAWPRSISTDPHR